MPMSMKLINRDLMLKANMAQVKFELSLKKIAILLLLLVCFYISFAENIPGPGHYRLPSDFGYY